MADGIGNLRIVTKRRFEDYKSMKMFFQHRHTKEVLFQRSQLSTAAGIELMEAGGETIAYLSANTTVYIRAEGVDEAGCQEKDLFIEYLDHAGALKTATVASAGDSSTEVEIADDFESLRHFYSTTEAVAAHHWLLCNIDGTAIYGVVEDGRLYSIHSRYRAPASTVCRSFLGRIQIDTTKKQTDTTDSSYQLVIAYTPKDRANVSEIVDFWDKLDYDISVELEPLSTVSFTIKKFTDADHKQVMFRSSILEVYAKI